MKLKEKIKSQGISQTELAKRIGGKVTAVNNLCSQGIKSIRIARKYAAALNCDWTDLIDEPAPRTRN